ncbi:DUF6302 family protein [Streptomyces uncialis]|uniref:DUF6302 family protein n=1 Tax=Streptomyces uncialis TaxID=1048205 RepID=UPI003669B26B
MIPLTPPDHESALTPGSDDRVDLARRLLLPEFLDHAIAVPVGRAALGGVRHRLAVPVGGPRRAGAFLVENDDFAIPVLHQLAGRIGFPRPRLRPTGFDGALYSVVAEWGEDVTHTDPLVSAMLYGYHPEGVIDYAREFDDIYGETPGIAATPSDSLDLWSIPDRPPPA